MLPISSACGQRPKHLIELAICGNARRVSSPNRRTYKQANRKVPHAKTTRVSPRESRRRPQVQSVPNDSDTRSGRPVHRPWWRIYDDSIGGCVPSSKQRAAHVVPMQTDARGGANEPGHAPKMPYCRESASRATRPVVAADRVGMATNDANHPIAAGRRRLHHSCSRADEHCQDSGAPHCSQIVIGT